MNTLYFGDNLDILRRFLPDASVDLIYLDPPFNSNRDYNVLFREQSGSDSPAQIKAFGDTWNWAGAAEAWADFSDLCPNPRVIELMHGFKNAIGENDVMAYLVMMAPRLYQLHRVLKPTGSLYLHCDPTASHYLKLILDGIFGPQNYKNEIIWKRTTAHSSAKRYAPIHDTIFFYTKSSKYTWTNVRIDYDEEYLNRYYKYDDGDGRLYWRADITGAGVRNGETGQPWRGINPTAKGRHWMVPPAELEIMDAQGRIYWPKGGGMPQHKRYRDELKGKAAPDLFDDINRINPVGNERLGYPTQKPIALLERIIAASSNLGDTVLDPFAGCGTAVVAAQKLGRNWIGIDVTPIATSLIQKRLFDAFGAKDMRLLSKADPVTTQTFRVEGLPTDLAGARALYDRDPSHKDFEMWAVGLVPAIPQEKKGADQGIDGIAYFNDKPKNPSKAIVQVKGGHVTASQIRDLRGVMAREKAALGFFLSLEAPTKAMENEATAAGFYTSPSGVGRRVPALQLRTIEDLLHGKAFDFPVYGSNVSFKQAAPTRTAADVVGNLFAAPIAPTAAPVAAAADYDPDPEEGKELEEE